MRAVDIIMIFVIGALVWFVLAVIQTESRQRRLCEARGGAYFSEGRADGGPACLKKSGLIEF